MCDGMGWDRRGGKDLGLCGFGDWRCLYWLHGLIVKRRELGVYVYVFLCWVEIWDGFV